MAQLFSHFPTVGGRGLRVEYPKNWWEGVQDYDNEWEYELMIYDKMTYIHVLSCYVRYEIQTIRVLETFELKTYN